MRGTLAIVALIVAALLLFDSSIGHRFVADQVAALRPSNGLRYSVGRINGSLFGRATLVDFRIRDRRGLVLLVPRAELDWSPLRWLDNRLQINRLTIPLARLARLPDLVRSGRQQPILPDFDIGIGRLTIDRLITDPAVTGQRRSGRVQGSADIRNGRAMIELSARIAASDSLDIKLDATPDRDRFDIDVHARGAADGLLAKLVGQRRRAVALDIAGDGRWSDWRGAATGSIGDARVLDLALTNKSGRYALNGTLVPSRMSTDKLMRLTMPRTVVTGAAVFADRRLDGRLTLRSSAMAIEAAGAIDLGRSAFDDLRVRVGLLQPSALIRQMVGRKVELRVILDGAFDRASFDYRLSGELVSFGKERFEQVLAAGRGRLRPGAVPVPLRLAVARVSGVDKVAGEILRNLVVEGMLSVTAAQIIGPDLQFRSDKLRGRINLRVDLKNGRYDVGINGGLGRFLIPGLGIVDVVSQLRVVPDPNGRGARILGTGNAQMIRLDNEFFATLAGGLPRMTTRLEQSTDGILHLNGLVLTAPDIRITGNGYRRKDGSFFFEGTGTQRTYGPLTIRLDGRIERPTLDLTFAHPADALGLSGVRAHLDPTPEGYRFDASGGSTLGDFTGNGRLLLPKGEQATADIAALDVGGLKASGMLRAVTGGFDGTMTVTGGVSGQLAFAPREGVQRIEAHLEARNARVLGDAVLRRGRLDGVAMLHRDGASLEGTVRGVGLRRGALSLARFEGKTSLRGGTGTASFRIAGTRGRAFDITADAAITPNRYSVTASGTVDRRPLALLEPAIITAEDDEWRIAPTQLTFAGGRGEVGGRVSSQSAAIDAKLVQMPLTILDIGFPGLGLAGNASGRLNYEQGASATPTGRIDVTVRGLSRSGLVLSSKPIDLGLAGALTRDGAALRAVMASEGKTIGRGQARLSPLGGGGLIARLANAQLFAQVRYDGPADTLWRLTGIELFDLSGPIAIGADLGGKVNDPRIRGIVRAKNARIESAVTGTVLSSVDAVGQFSGSRLSLTSFSADAGKGGRVTGTGSFDFAAVNGFGIDLSVQADKALMINRDDIAATVTGPLTFRSDGSGGVIAGDVKLDTARYRFGQAAAATAVPVLNIREINLPDGGEDDDRPLKPWALAIHARAADGLRVTGLGLTSEWSADLQIAGAPDSPSITGRADIIRGVYEFSGREFDIDRGIIRFGGEIPANPAIDIIANADSTGLSASIRVSGPATRPEISFTSIPSLPQDELLSRLLFGTSITNLSAPEALQLAAAVASLQSGGNGLNPINALRRAVGLDRLRVLPADTTVGRSASVAAGKYITRRLYAEIISDGAGYSATQIEFRVTRWLSVLSTISTIGRQSVNVRVSRDY